MIRYGWEWWAEVLPLDVALPYDGRTVTNERSFERENWRLREDAPLYRRTSDDVAEHLGVVDRLVCTRRHMLLGGTLRVDVVTAGLIHDLTHGRLRPHVKIGFADVTLGGDGEGIVFSSGKVIGVMLGTTPVYADARFTQLAWRGR